MLAPRARSLPAAGVDRQKEIDDLAQVDRLIEDADRRIRDLERTMKEAVADWHDVSKAEDLLARLRLALVKYKARRAAIAQFIDDMESGRL
jgi:hypothetical protein